MTDSTLPEPHADSESTKPPRATTRSDRRVQEGSEESFPASDPPSYMGSRSPESGSSTRGTGEELPPERQWAIRLVRALDRGEVETISGMLADDVIVRIGPGPLLVGREQTLDWIRGWLSQQSAVTRQIVDVRAHEDALFIEMNVEGQTADGESRTWPEAISVRLRREIAVRMTVYGAWTIAMSLPDDAERSAANDD